MEPYDKEKVRTVLKEILFEKFMYDVNEVGSYQLADYFDSINFIILVISIEERFDIKFPDNQLTIHVLTSFDYLVDLIYSLILRQEEQDIQI